MKFRLALLIIWITGVTLIIVFGLKNPGSYALILFSLIQLISVISVYKKVNRKIEGDILLQSEKPARPLFFLLKILLLIVLTNVYAIVFKKLDYTYWIAILAIIVTSAAAGYLIVKGRRIPFLILSSDELIINELIVSRYDLKKLEQISFDGFNENYTFVFNNAQKFVLRPEYYTSTDMDSLIATIKSRSNRNVDLSPNLLPVN